MASKMPSRILKKECAGILETMKVNITYMYIDQGLQIMKLSRHVRTK